MSTKEQHVQPQHRGDQRTIGDEKVPNGLAMEEHEHSPINEKLGVPFAVESVALVRHLPVLFVCLGIF